LETLEPATNKVNETAQSMRFHARGTTTQLPRFRGSPTVWDEQQWDLFCKENSSKQPERKTKREYCTHSKRACLWNLRISDPQAETSARSHNL